MKGSSCSFPCPRGTITLSAAAVVALGLFGLVVLGRIEGADSASPIEFPPARMIQWEEHSFGAATSYRLTEADGRAAVHAVCDDRAASGLFHEQAIDLNRTPILEWSWRVDETLSGIDETARSGDDYPARIYVVDEWRLLRWRTRAINYLWASEQPAGSHWPNAYNSRVHMVAVRAGVPDEPGTWFTERTNLRADFERVHGHEPDRITHVAIMTDCDDTGQRTEAWYGAIRFLPSR